MDELIFKRAQRGDAEAFEELIAAYEKGIYNLALKIMCQREDAMDMTQNAILRIYQSLSKFRGDSSLSTWIYRITTNICLDELRKRRNKTVSMEQLAEKGVLLTDDSLSPQRAAEANQIQRAVNNAIAALDEQSRAVFVLRDLKGLSYQEISDILQCEMGTMKSRLNRARAKLAKQLEPYRELFFE
ncbi:MAG: RNA polymerase sigma factor [Christensenellales bacterium]